MHDGLICVGRWSSFGHDTLLSFFVHRNARHTVIARTVISSETQLNADIKLDWLIVCKKDQLTRYSNYSSISSHTSNCQKNL